MMRILFPGALAVLTAVIFSCQFFNTQGPSGEITMEEMTRCTADGDCIMTRKTCCGCEAGGESFSINKIYDTYWNELVDGQCGADVLCPAVMVCTATIPVCLNGSCMLAK